MIKSLNKEIYIVDSETVNKSDMLSFFLQNHEKAVLSATDSENTTKYYTYESVVHNIELSNETILFDADAFKNAREFFMTHRQDFVPVYTQAGELRAFLGYDTDVEEECGTSYFNRDESEFEFLKEYDVIYSDEVTEQTFNFIQKIVNDITMPPVCLGGEDWNIFKELLPYNESVTWADKMPLEYHNVFNTSQLYRYFNPKVICFIDDTEECKNLMERIGNMSNIVGFLKNGGAEAERQVQFSSIKRQEFDAIVICAQNDKSIERQLVYGYGIPKSMVYDKKYLLKIKMLQKYRFSEDSEIQDILHYWKDHKLSVYNQRCHTDTDVKYNVAWDADVNMPYVIFEGKRMYYPREYGGICYDKYQMPVIHNILGEQSSDSPHLYIDDKVYVKEGDVILDAGVCEGNFALRYVDIASKIYLAECDKNWMEALHMTFAPYKDKVIFCDKMLTGTNGSDKITIDSLVEGKLDFVKMDIEGAEADALLGARRMFESNDIRCAICGYHKEHAAEYISNILESYGYETEYSKGYMVFEYDEDIWHTSDFRRGIVHGRKIKDGKDL